MKNLDRNLEMKDLALSGVLGSGVGLSGGTSGCNLQYAQFARDLLWLEKYTFLSLWFEMLEEFLP